ncbi:uncharacterized protein LOC116737394 isoform X5 [Xiphophorus hellerii]|uniref:uncharacterized protein LOC116712660 isoform X4 n=1 Tax=Xiphophorus hellerii TaxID=8084 RepID=UPI0013B37F19|nr:uncharacterized protein LOC116712660 isoform X4 [Xiphophorus hellerii]XP_032437820.1 uncharacterized protein LOC116731980 isoform X4 [Xiphophorus hellerii]XP_032446409.1 uncharacterized protein LOC116737394 isoform X5 [Xiphophorus hellerii]
MSSSHFIPSPSKMSREALWSVVQFPNGGTAVVLESWFKAEEQTLLWPPKHITLKKALRDGMQPDDKWITYTDVRVLITCETLDEAKKRETKYNTTMCPTSEIESHDEGAIRQKRISRPNQQFMHSDSEDHQSSSAKRKRFAKPPDVGCPVDLVASNYQQSLADEVLNANSDQNDVLDSAPNQGFEDATTQRASNNGQLLRDLAIHKMTSMLAEALVIVKDLSRDVQFIKNNLAQSNITPGSTQGPANLVLPFQLPIESEEDFSKAESLLIEETVRQKMIARLALVGGTNSANMIRRMLTTCMRNALASQFNWAGKKHRHSQSKKPFKDTILQECILVAARQFEPGLTDQNYSETVKKWFRYAPDREGGIERQPKGRPED